MVPHRRQNICVEIGFDEGTSTALPYRDESFDVVLSTLFFHHLPDDAKRTTASELLRVLRPWRAAEGRLPAQASEQ